MTREWFYSFILGLILLLFGGWLVYAEMQNETVHSGHIYTGVGVAILGALLINPTPGKSSPLLVVVKSLVVTIAPIVPWSKVAKERRSTEVTARPRDDEGPSGG